MERSAGERLTARESLRIVAPFVVGTVIHMGVLSGAQWTFPGTWFYEFGPGPSPPWYFIGQSAIEALWAAGGLICLCIFTGVAAGRLGATVWAAFGVSASSAAVGV